jgi:hypothetical protein
VLFRSRDYSGCHPVGDATLRVQPASHANASEWAFYSTAQASDDSPAQVLPVAGDPTGLLLDLANLTQAIARAAAPETDAKRLRADALALLLRAAASDYATAIASPEAIDIVPFAEAHGFVMTARERATELAADADPAVAKAGQKMLTALAEAESLFEGAPTAGDPAVLLATAARFELAASGVK